METFVSIDTFHSLLQLQLWQIRLSTSDSVIILKPLQATTHTIWQQNKNKKLENNRRPMLLPLILRVQSTNNSRAYLCIKISEIILRINSTFTSNDTICIHLYLK